MRCQTEEIKQKMIVEKENLRELEEYFAKIDANQRRQNEEIMILASFRKRVFLAENILYAAATSVQKIVSDLCSLTRPSQTQPSEDSNHAFQTSLPQFVKDGSFDPCTTVTREALASRGDEGVARRFPKHFDVASHASWASGMAVRVVEARGDGEVVAVKDRMDARQPLRRCLSKAPKDSIMHIV